MNFSLTRKPYGHRNPDKATTRFIVTVRPAGPVVKGTPCRVKTITADKAMTCEALLAIIIAGLTGEE